MWIHNMGSIFHSILSYIVFKIGQSIVAEILSENDPERKSVLSADSPPIKWHWVPHISRTQTQYQSFLQTLENKNMCCKYLMVPDFFWRYQSLPIHTCVFLEFSVLDVWKFILENYPDSIWEDHISHWMGYVTAPFSKKTITTLPSPSVKI